jgi:two-component system, cell cycle response regulator
MSPFNQKPLFQKITEEIYLCPFGVGKEYLEHSLALIVSGSELLLVGLPLSHQIELILLECKKMFPASQLAYIVMSGYSANVLSSLQKWRALSPETCIISDVKHLHYFNLEGTLPFIYRIEQNNYQLVMKSGKKLTFIPSPFIMSAGSFMTYDFTNQTLFSGYLFSNPVYSASASFQEYVSNALKYLSNYLPSSDFVRYTLKQIQSLSIARVITIYGNVLEEQQTTQLITTLSTFDFYNLTGLSMYKQPNSVDYIQFSNQILRKLRSIYGTLALQELFEDTPFSYDESVEEVRSTVLEGFRLWHRLFELIYAKKGVSWLAVVEPIIDKLVELYDIKKPSIYQSQLITSSKQLHQLDLEKNELVSKVAVLELEMQSTVDRLVKDPLTNLYNEFFLKGTLARKVESLASDNPKPFSLLYIAVDHMHRINRTYSYQIGDETIKHFGIFLQENIQEEDRLFRASGISFALIIERELAEQELDSLLSKVRESTLFVQSITASIALVRSVECSLDHSTEAAVNFLMNSAENRIQTAFQKGGNQIISQDTLVRKATRGKVLLVEDDKIHANYIRTALENESFDVDWAQDGIEALNRIQEHVYHAIVCDKFVPKLDGFSLKTQINKTAHQGTCFLLMVHTKTAETISRANRLGITAVLSRPILIEELVGFIQRNQMKRG